MTAIGWGVDRQTNRHLGIRFAINTKIVIYPPCEASGRLSRSPSTVHDSSGKERNEWPYGGGLDPCGDGFGLIVDDPLPEAVEAEAEP